MTHLLYLSDTYMFESSWIIREKWENEYGHYIILDQTIFYPQWGGQPSDTGMISSESGTFEVEMVRLDEHGTVYHYGVCRDGIFTPGESVTLEIDREKRILNARNHSAGHLIDIAMRNIWLSHMKLLKWYHFADGPYVEYSGNLHEPVEWVILRLQMEIDRLIEWDIKMIITYDMNVKSPEGKTPRYAHFEGYDGCGCGGTHVQSSGEIGKVTIRKIKIKDGNTRVSYSIA
jgi:Ser-tRNA(Ala) deacylase AlaX